MTVYKLFLHVGLHKTGTTFLQRNVFPVWPGLTYLKWRNIEYLIRLQAGNIYLMSCEGFSGATFASLDERCRGLHRLGAMFPGAYPIIGVRRHGDFLASLYSQYIRYGGKESISGFFALSKSAAHTIFQRESISFRRLIEETEVAFQRAPFVYDMRKMFGDMPAFLQDLGAYLGLPAPSLGSIVNKVENSGLGRWQANILRWINDITQARFSYDGRNRPYARLARLHLDPPTVCTGLLGYLPSPPLVDRKIKQQIDDCFEEDWNYVQSYLAERPWQAVR
jgi:hypothetical protein